MNNGATAHEGQSPPYLSTGDLGWYEQMFRSGGQSDTKPLVFRSQEQAWCSFIDPLKGVKAESTLLSPSYRGLSPSRELNPGPVAWKRETLPRSHWVSHNEEGEKKNLELDPFDGDPTNSSPKSASLCR
ncbi:hypothetical protein TNCV_1677501 [Trichonephila clavipes]|nr:hypothetical protein TNCV_1677501 [Trichonephila clavipes]